MQIAEPIVTADFLIHLHRTFSLSTPYENASIQLAETSPKLTTGVLDRIAAGSRGGWRYELNELFARMLERIGFNVRRVVGAGSRETLSDFWIGGHLVLMVDLPDGPWLADVGYGDGPLDPVPLKEREFRSHFFSCSLRRIGNGWWRNQNDTRASAPSFDFHESDEGTAEWSRMTK